MISWKKISSPSIFIGIGAGLLLGILCTSLFIWYLISSAVTKTPADTQGVLLGGQIDNLRQGLLIQQREKEATTVYGRMVSMSNGTLVLEVRRSAADPQKLTFVYDNNTTIVKLANDAASTELPLSSDAVEVGAGLTVSTHEPIGSVEHQYAVKIIQL